MYWANQTKALALHSSWRRALQLQLCSPLILIWYINTVGFSNIGLPFWQLLLLSGICQVIYLVGLGVAYKQADIGVIYPMARALPVLMVGFGTLLLGYSLTYNQWVGFTLITLGCLVVPLKSFKDLRATGLFESRCTLGTHRGDWHNWLFNHR